MSVLIELIVAQSQAIFLSLTRGCKIRLCVAEMRLAFDFLISLLEEHLEQFENAIDELNANYQ